MNPYLFDTTVAYNGLHHFKTGNQKVARIHGFTLKNVRCNVVIDDRGASVTAENREYKATLHLFNLTHIFALSHVKGHVITGMGGTTKNFGMG